VADIDALYEESADKEGFIKALLDNICMYRQIRSSILRWLAACPHNITLEKAREVKLLERAAGNCLSPASITELAKMYSFTWEDRRAALAAFMPWMLLPMYQCKRRLFRELCRTSNIYALDLLFDDVTFLTEREDEAMYFACRNGARPLMKWLRDRVTQAKDEGIAYLMYKAMRFACGINDLTMMKGVAQQGLTSADIRAHDNALLRISLLSGQVEIAEWLKTTFNLTADDVRSGADCLEFKLLHRMFCSFKERLRSIQWIARTFPGEFPKIESVLTEVEIELAFRELQQEHRLEELKEAVAAADAVREVKKEQFAVKQRRCFDSEYQELVQRYELDDAKFLRILAKEEARLNALTAAANRKFTLAECFATTISKSTFQLV